MHSAQEAICFLGVSFSFSLLSTSALKPVRVLFITPSTCLSSSNTCHPYCHPLRKSNQCTHAPFDLFQWFSPKGNLFCSLCLSYQLSGQSARGHPSSYWMRRRTRFWLGVIMDHTWSCSSGSPRAGAQCVGTARPPALLPLPLTNP